MQAYQGKGSNNLCSGHVCRVDGMPSQCSGFSYIDFVLPLDKIAEELVKIGARVAQD
jgi:chemotaxis response regulator CheB